MIIYEKILFPDTNIRSISSVKGSKYDSIFSSSYNGKDVVQKFASSNRINPFAI
jgi:hypothetical protein